MFGRHSLKIGGEYRQFLNNNFGKGTGSFNFPSVAAFLAGTANSFSVTLGNQSSSIAQGALGFFVQDNYKWRPNLTFELGLRYDWNMTPRSATAASLSLTRQTRRSSGSGTEVDEIYHQNNKNFQPRLGFAWDPFNHGKTSVRGAYAILVDQPMTSVVTGTSRQPAVGHAADLQRPIRFDNAIGLARAAGLAPTTVDHGFDNAYVQSWNFNRAARADDLPSH